MPAPTLKPEGKASLDAILNTITSAPNEGGTKEAPTQHIPGIAFGAINANGDIIYEGYSGTLSEGGTAQVTPATIFPAWSTTKWISVTSILHLFSTISSSTNILDDPELVEKHLPELSTLKLAKLNAQGSLELKNVTSRLTPKMLLNHTSGLGYSFFNPETREYWLSEKPNKSWEEIDEFSGSVEGIKGPFLANPGEKWIYGTGIDWAGLLLERITGIKLGAYAKKHIFDPLGVKDCDFDLRDDLKNNLIGMSKRDETGKISPKDHLPFTHTPPASKFHSGGAGLLTNIRSYLTILTILLNNGVGKHSGTKQEVKILNPEWAKFLLGNTLTPEQAEHLSNDIHDARPDLTNFIAGPNLLGIPKGKSGWSLAGVTSDVALPTGRKEGSVAWAGLANLLWEADPKTGIATFGASQILPFVDLPFFGTNIQLEATLYQNLVS